MVGATLILLDLYVFGALFSKGGPVSRGQVILAVLSGLHRHKTAYSVQDQRYGPKSSLSLGVLHGFGAVTPALSRGVGAITAAYSLWIGLVLIRS